MYLVHIFRANPPTGLAVCVCLVTILWCIGLTRRQNSRLDRVLTALLGMIAIYQALHMLTDSGLEVLGGFRKLDGWVEFLIATLCLIAALILKLSSLDRTSTKVRLRLVEANEKAPESALGAAPAPTALETTFSYLDASPLAMFAVDSRNIVIYWNPAAAALLGWKREEALESLAPFDGHSKLLNKRGRRVEAAIWTAPIQDSKGSTWAMLIIAASGSALRGAGIGEVHQGSPAELVLNH